MKGCHFQKLRAALVDAQSLDYVSDVFWGFFFSGFFIGGGEVSGGGGPVTLSTAKKTAD